MLLGQARVHGTRWCTLLRLPVADRGAFGLCTGSASGSYFLMSAIVLSKRVESCTHIRGRSV